jgi:hypothetical protein
MVVCSECGGSKITTRAWVDANTNEVTDSDAGGDSSDNWCEDCEDHLKFDVVNTDDDGNCPYCGVMCWAGNLAEMCDEQQAGGF